MVVVWSRFARQNLESIFDYISRTSHYYAHAVRKEILALSRSLNKFPESGRMVPERGMKEYQEQFIYSYRMIYKIKGNEIRIIALVHMSQSLTKSLLFE